MLFCPQCASKKIKESSYPYFEENISRHFYCKKCGYFGSIAIEGHKAPAHRMGLGAKI
ncbi:MAG: hypothetical protein KAS30_01935 [Candidatus Diapherotrites archaeon]|nr:hypothetical protein [Candidatus Diapherotrites archaeon]